MLLTPDGRKRHTTNKGTPSTTPRASPIFASPSFPPPLYFLLAISRSRPQSRAPLSLSAADGRRRRGGTAFHRAGHFLTEGMRPLPFTDPPTRFVRDFHTTLSRACFSPGDCHTSRRRNLIRALLSPETVGESAADGSVWSEKRGRLAGSEGSESEPNTHTAGL